MATPKSDLGGAIVSFGHPQVAEQLKSKYCENNSVEFIFFYMEFIEFQMVRIGVIYLEFLLSYKF